MALYSYAKKFSRPVIKEYSDRFDSLLIRVLATVFSLFIYLLTGFLLNRINNKQVSPVSAQTESVKSLSSKQWNNETMQQSDDKNVLGETTGLNNSPSPTISININMTPTISISPPEDSKNVQQNPTKSLYTIAIFGDSMVDTMGEVLEYLDAELTKKYPKTEFLLYNYGKGAENVEMGLNRLGSTLKYQSRDYPSLPELKPDILIVGSFAYNPFTPHDRDKHWLTLTKLVQTAKQYTPRVYILAEIAPLREDFGKGPQGVNWSDDANYEHSLRIIQQLENAVGLSTTLGVPLIDTFTPSFNSEAREGKREYVNPSDGIHPSVAGHQFMAEKIAQTINLH